MLNLKSRVQKTKEFVQQHQTLTACAVTAVATAYMVRDRDIKVMKSIAAFAAIQNVKGDERDAMLMDAVSYIQRKDLWEEFLEVAPQRRR